MNIIEAIESGKPFKRKYWPKFYPVGHLKEDDWYKIHTDDLLADDWEVEKGPVTITEKDFNLAVQRTLHEIDPDEHGFWDKLRKNIGL